MTGEAVGILVAGLAIGFVIGMLTMMLIDFGVERGVERRRHEANVAVALRLQRYDLLNERDRKRFRYE